MKQYNCCPLTWSDSSCNKYAATWVPGNPGTRLLHGKYQFYRRAYKPIILNQLLSVL